MALPKSDTPKRRAARPSGQYEVVGPRGGKSAVEYTVKSAGPLPAARVAKAIQTIKLKKAGGSLMMTVPASARDALHLSEGQEMTVAVEGESLVLKPVAKVSAALIRKPRYTLDELVAQCSPNAALTDEERAWMDEPAAGNETW